VRYQPLDGPTIREAEALADAGFDVVVVCLREPGEPRWEDAGTFRVRRVRLPKRRGTVARYLVEYAAWFLFGFAWLTAHHLRRRWTVIQVSTLPDLQAFATLIPRLLGAKVVVFLKEPTGELFEAIYGSARLSRVLNAISSLAIRYSHRAFAVSELHRQMYLDRGIDPAKIVAVLNVVPIERLTTGDREQDEEHFVVVCHGMVEPRNGHAAIVQAAALARDRLPTLRIVISGRGGYTDAMLDLADELGVADIVTYRGFLSVDDLAHLLRSADAGISYQQESAYSHVVHTNKMFEFLGLGIPVLSSRLRANEAYFEEGEMLFVEPDNPADLASALVTLGTDPERRRRQAEAGRQAYHRYRWELEAEKYLDHIRSAL
ncbi:MAG: glycosyltransferase, partial [Acidimicrobiia bacterium]|nr:glycosyltransferase [Acidimicrobiia bacterium]